MAVDTKIELIGVQDAIKALRKIDPELRKQFNRDAKAIAEPVLNKARQDYPELPLSGMARNWKDKSGRAIFPWNANKARRGLRVKIDTSRKSTNVIYLQQADPAGAVFEGAGRRSDHPIGRLLGPLRAHNSRVLGPALNDQRGDVERGFERLARDTMRQVQQELR